MWNNQGTPGGYGSPPGFPGTPSFPAPGGGFAPPLGPPSGFPTPGGQGGYDPGYIPSYAPPPGPPGFPGSPPSYGGYAPPPGPPGGGYALPPGPPGGGYAPPSVSFGGGGGYPGQQYHQTASYGGGGGYAPPAGPPPHPPSQEQTYGPQFRGNNNKMHQPFFQYSQCNGKKKALCIGINYIGQQNALRGCINDVHNVQRFLCSFYGYKIEDIVKLTDDASNPRQLPTRENIINAMQWLVRDARPNDSLFFHYSGHGGQTKDLDGDEDDGYDEVIYPVDFQKNGHIVDDLMHDIMVKPLPPGCRLTAIFDSCHSGTALDLPYVYSTEGKIKEPNLVAEAGQGLLSAFTSYSRGDVGGALTSAMGILKAASGGRKAEQKTKQTKTSPADVISWSGCKDSQTSADAQEAGSATGAMSYAFIQCLTQNRQQSFQQLLIGLRTILKAKYSQKPQLSSSHPMDTNIMFIC